MPKCRKKYYKEYYEKNKEICILRNKNYRDKIKHTESYLEGCRQRGRKYRKSAEQYKRIRECVRKNYNNKKNQCIREYGGACYCCAESIPELLTLDHINNDGKLHRAVVGSHTMWAWAFNNNFPKDILRLSCFNCNSGRQRTENKLCPHQLQARILSQSSEIYLGECINQAALPKPAASA